jgi:hypothetical protein
MILQAGFDLGTFSILFNRPTRNLSSTPRGLIPRLPRAGTHSRRIFAISMG